MKTQDLDRDCVLASESTVDVNRDTPVYGLLVCLALWVISSDFLLRPAGAPMILATSAGKKTGLDPNMVIRDTDLWGWQEGASTLVRLGMGVYVDVFSDR